MVIPRPVSLQNGKILNNGQHAAFNNTNNNGGGSRINGQMDRMMMDKQVEAGQMDMVDGGVDTVDSVVNSAANNLLPKQISSSLSSGLSVGSVKVFSKFPIFVDVQIENLPEPTTKRSQWVDPCESSSCHLGLIGKWHTKHPRGGESGASLLLPEYFTSQI